MKRIIFAIIGAVCAVSAMMAQTRVTGTVFDSFGEPCIGATISEKGHPANVTAADIDGNFSLNVTSLNATIVASYLGMETQEVKLAGRSNVEIHLKDNNIALDEVVVVGYGVQKKINATGSVKTIDSEVLESRPLSNAVQGLQGAVAGLNITNDAGGALGESMNINIRGVGSIGEGSSSSPLILIDGMEGDLNTINPADIANISVLKDAAAASIYGSRAPFGVILITTKSGEKGTRVSYTGNFRISNPMKVPNMVDGVTFCRMVNDAYLNSGGSAAYSESQINKIQKFMNGELPYATGPSADGTEWLWQQMAWGSTNWYDVYLKDHTTSQDHNFTITGGGDKVDYYFSGGFMDQTGLFNFADEEYTRLSLSGRVGVKFNDYVRMTWTTRFININNEKPSILNNMFYHQLGRRQVTEAVILPNGEYSEKSMINSMLNGGRQKQTTQQLYNQLNLVVEPIKDWQIHVDLSSRIENNPFTRQFNPVYTTMPDGTQSYYPVYETTSKPVITDNGSFNIYPAAGESFYEKAHNRIDYFSTNLYTDYSMTLAEKHNFKFLVGQQTEWYKTETTRVGTFNVQLTDKPFLPSISGDPTTMTSDRKSEWASYGIFGRVNYNFDNRYMLEVNLRGDAASRFPTDQRWGFFPSFSVGWNIGEEAFWRSLSEKGFQYLKLRGSYGTLGNQNTTSFYPYYQKMAVSAGNVILGGSTASVLPVYSPYSVNLTWEKIENAGVGLDFGLMNNRLTGAFDWYQRKTKDMVGPAAALPGIYGDKAPKTNNAELRTRGWEFEISWRDRINKDWSYGISASISDYETVITKYDSPDNTVVDEALRSNTWYVGKKVGDLWGYTTIGIAQSDAEMREHLSHTSQAAISSTWGGGDLMYADLDGSGAVDAGTRTLADHGDLSVIGNSTPRYAYSFTLETQWKFIDVRAFFQGIGKRDLLFHTSNGYFYGFGGNAWQRYLMEEHLDYFRYAGSELGENMGNPYFARLRTDGANTQCADRFVQNGAYLRLKNLQIGFNLPENNPFKKFIRKGRLYFSAENLFTWSKLKIYDPEAVGTMSGDYSDKTYPQYRTFAVGLEITFGAK